MTGRDGCTVRRLSAEEVEEVADLFGRTIAEILPRGDDGAAQARVKDAYSAEKLTTWIDSPDRHLYVVRRHGEAAGFLFGRTSCRVGHIHWIGVGRSHRDGGIGGALVRRALRDFAKAGCYQADLFVSPRLRRQAGFFTRLGFEKRAVLSGTMLGSSAMYMLAKLREASDEEMTRRIIVVGDAGQGIRLLGHVLASVLTSLGKEVALNVTKPSSVRGGTIAAELCYSDGPLRTPFFVDADILVQLSPGAPPHTVRAEHVIMDQNLVGVGLSGRVKRRGRHREDEVHQFVRDAREDLGNPVLTNMIALGSILGHMGFDIEKLSLPEELPPRFLADNLRAIQLGYAYDMPSVY
jgi:Pyruvate/2-oxoacid:ferredoxin oxidoreductase gamma subunit/ribosomal protein S18 acetylase RimI-like enzyme